jgi:hypothetical protein
MAKALCIFSFFAFLALAGCATYQGQLLLGVGFLFLALIFLFMLPSVKD